MVHYCSVSFNPIKMNRTCYIAVCGVDDDSGVKERPWRHHASIPKNSNEYFKIKSFVREHTCYVLILPIQSSLGNDIFYVQCHNADSEEQS